MVILLIIDGDVHQFINQCLIPLDPCQNYKIGVLKIVEPIAGAINIDVINISLRQIEMSPAGLDPPPPQGLEIGERLL